MNKEEALVSVLVPAYNSSRYIEDCLESIRFQTYKNIELIIADDCSQDDTIDKIAKWIKKHGSVFVRCELVCNQVNLGICGNFNSLINQANGKYIKLIAADDILLQDAIKKERDYLEQNKEYDLVFANALLINEDDQYPLKKDIDEYKLFYTKEPLYGKGIAKELFNDSFIAAPTVMFKKNTFERFGYYREDIPYEDWEYWLRISSQGGNIGFLNEPVVAYRFLQQSSSHFRKGKKEEERFRKTIIKEELFLSEYAEKIANCTMDSYWNRTMIICIENGYHSIANDIWYSHRKSIKQKTKIKYRLFRIHLFNILKCIKNVIVKG